MRVLLPPKIPDPPGPWKMYYAEGLRLESARHRLGFFGLVSRSGILLGKSAVQRILTNPVYIGLIVSNGETFQGSFEPLIGNELFEAVEEQLRKRSKPRKSRNRHDFPFTGLLSCGECGGAITAQYGKGNGGTYVYYRFSKKFGKCEQPYMRDESMKEQISALLQKASLPESWAGPAFAQLDRWEEEERGKLRSFAQKRASSISEIQEKLDRLVGGFLDGIIDRDTYLAKKEQLIRQKIQLEQDQAGFGEGASRWVEPMREWLETAHKAGKLAFSDDYLQMKQILEQIGTNRQVFQKEVEVEFVRPFGSLLRAKVLWEGLKASGVGKKEGLSPEFEESPLWSG